MLVQAFIADWDDWDEIVADWDEIIPVTPCHWDELIPMDGGWLPHWDEALDQSTEIIEAVYFASYLYGGRSPPGNQIAKYIASIIPVD